MLKFLKKISQIGISRIDNKPERRALIASNVISLILTGSSILLLFIRFIAFRVPVNEKVLFFTFLYLIPIVLNYFYYYRLSKMVLCWLPTIAIMILYIYVGRKAITLSTAEYDGLRIFLLAFSLNPFLLLNTKNRKEFIPAILLPFLVIVFCDPILNFFGAGYATKGTHGDHYEYNSVRTVIAYIMLGASCYAIKRMVEKGDEENAMYIEELSLKNKIIKKNAKQRIKETTSRLALATESAGIGIWELDLGTDKVIWDKQMHTLFGIEYGSVDDIDWRTFIHTEDYPDVNDSVEEAVKLGKNFNTEFRIQKSNNETLYLYTFGKVYYEKDKANKIIGVCWDITDKKRAENSLRLSEANMAATVNNTIYFVWSVNSNFEIININKPFRNYLKERFNIEVNECESLVQKKEVDEFSDRWINNYMRALAGEYFEIEEERSSRYFKYALNPIIENAMITGVSVFAEETTGIKRKEKELIEANRKIAELKLMALRAAMNPHFLFNSLNSIQYFIMVNDQKNAMQYLSTFSKLIRGILNNSIHNKIKLSEELDQLQYYIKLEQLRFENKFDFILEVDPNLELDSIEIPSMLIQPYVENAILHGLYNKLTNGTLKIGVHEYDEYIIFEIEDDGVGREMAKTIRLQSLPLHNSLGTAITEERLRLINSEKIVSFDIIDLEKDGIATGTKVKIYVKV